MDLSNAEEMTIDKIMWDWFRYEPKEETGAARRKYQDERKKVRAILDDGIKNDQLKHRIETKEIKRDVFPNSSTGKFATELEDKLYQGLPYTRIDSIKTIYITLQDLAQFLESFDLKPPEDSPLYARLVNWLDDTGPRDQVSGAKTYTPNNNYVKTSGLLKDPEKQDSWFYAIDDMTNDYFLEHENMPNEIQAWTRLWNNPPKGYDIKTGQDKKEDCLIMPGEKPLSRTNFKKRWLSYRK